MEDGFNALLKQVATFSREGSDVVGLLEMFMGKVEWVYSGRWVCQCHELEDFRNEVH